LWSAPVVTAGGARGWEAGRIFDAGRIDRDE
jgi:hypothetical protein